MTEIINQYQDEKNVDREKLTQNTQQKKVYQFFMNILSIQCKKRKRNEALQLLLFTFIRASVTSAFRKIFLIFGIDCTGFFSCFSLTSRASS